MFNIICEIQHKINPLHLHCSLVKHGMVKETSFFVCKCYEKSIFIFIDLTLKTMLSLSKKGIFII